MRELAWRALVDTVGDAAQLVRREDEWEALLAETRRRLGPVFQELAKTLSQVLVTWGGINRDLAGGRPLPDAILDDLRSQLDDMLYPGFLLELEPGRLEHYPRYLQAAAERLERARMDPGKDLKLLVPVSEAWRRYLDWLEAGNDYTLELDRYRWLVAEYRVSVFAQRLGTAEKVSPKRLESAWREVRAAA